MKSPIRILVMSVAVYAASAASEPVPVSLADYAFDFPTSGFEIQVTGTTKNYTDTLTADDFINIVDNGYTLKTLIDRMNRKDRQQFISFFNAHCILGFGPGGCAIMAAGDIELDEKMRMIFRMSTVTISIGPNKWSNREEK